MYSSPHSIRLREPWTWCARSSSSGVASGAGGSAWGQRRFHRPTGLADRDRVVLVVEPWSGGQVVLNGQCLAGTVEPDGSWRCEVKDQLQLRNQLELELSGRDERMLADRVGAFRRNVIAAGGVRLEIHGPSGRSDLAVNPAAK